VAVQVHWVSRLVDQTALAVLLQCLFLVLLSSDLCVVLEDAPAFITSLNVFAIDAFAVLVARDARLEALTVLFQTFALFAIASFCVSLLGSITLNIAIHVVAFFGI
jgi:hypothetical protein